MKNLLERLKPKYLELLEQEKKLNPLLVDSVKKELKVNKYVMDLTFGICNRMNLIFKPKYKGITLNPYQYFKD